jgi:hypothetical protein
MADVSTAPTLLTRYVSPDWAIKFSGPQGNGTESDHEEYAMFVLWTSTLGLVAVGCWVRILHPAPTRAVTRPLSLWRTRRCTERLLRDLAAAGQLVPPLPRREDEHLNPSCVTIVRRKAPTKPEPSGDCTPDVVA